MSGYNDSYKYIYEINPTKSDGIICPQKVEPLGISNDMTWTCFINRRKLISMSSRKAKQRTITDQDILNTPVENLE